MTKSGLILGLALVGASAVGFVWGGWLGMVPLFFLGHATDNCCCECKDR